MSTASPAQSLVASAPAPSRLSWPSRLLLLAFGLSMLLAGLGRRTLTQHEVFAAYPAKEMLRYGHWIVQMFAGIPRTAKPPTTGWFIAAAMAVFHSDAEWVARLPSVLAGMALAMMIASFAARRFGERVGLVAGLVQLTCFYVPLQARLAEADMLAAAAVCAAMMCLAAGTLPPMSERHDGQRGAWGWSIGFYVFAAMSFLLKAVPLVFVVLAAVTWLAIRRERRVLRFLLNPAGLLILLAGIVAWPLAAYLSYPRIIDSWRFELFGTATGKLGYDPIYSYLLSIPAMLLPWTPMMLIPLFARISACRDNHGSPGGPLQLLKRLFAGHPLRQFVLAWFLPGVVFLHFSAFKHKHYPIPMLPPLSILGAVGLLAYIDYQHRNPRPRRALAAALWAGGCAIAAIVVWRFDSLASMPLLSHWHLDRVTPDLRAIASPVLAIVGILCAGGLAAIWAEHRKHTAGQLAAIFATIWLTTVTVSCWIVPAVDDYRHAADLAAEANRLVPAGQPILIIDAEKKVEPQIAYYLARGDRRLWRYPDEQAFVEFARWRLSRTPQPLYVIATEGQLPEIEEAAQVQVLATSRGIRRHEGENQRLVLVRVTQGR